MSISQDDRFTFDVLGYLHLRNALTPTEVADYLAWAEAVAATDLQALNADFPEGIKQQLNRPLSRMWDADPRFARFLDHPVVVPYLHEFAGADYRHIDNDLYFTYPGYTGGHWHRGVRTHPTGHVVDGVFVCPMVKVFYCLTDVGPGEGEFVVIPGSHKAQFKLEYDGRIDLPAQHIFDDVGAGDIIIFNEGLIHNGRPNRSQKIRKTIIVNFGRKEAGVWRGYRPKPETLAAVSATQRQILTNEHAGYWKEPALATTDA
jgi:ectoine hydroxylase-related dioxygenase (phytanoyl-CoA dioxygenase family)